MGYKFPPSGLGKWLVNPNVDVLYKYDLGSVGRVFSQQKCGYVINSDHTNR